MMTGFGTQINCGLNLIALNGYTIINWLVDFEQIGQWVGGVMIGVTFSFSTRSLHDSWDIIVSRMVMLSNLDCSFQATNVTDLYRFLAEDCGYI